MEFQDTYGVMVGEEGRGIRTIIEMVSLNRVYCAMSSAGQMRQSLVQAVHHTTHRSAFQKRLIQQPLMQNVLAELAVEAEGALALGLRTACAVDASLRDEHEAALARILTPMAKYWNTKRAPYAVFEALECHGGPGYVEEAPLARMYREAPLNSIWEGSGNVMCLDVLRALGREPASVEALFAELEAARGADSRLDAAIDEIREEVGKPDDLERRMRGVVELMALALQGALLTRDGAPEVAEAFCASRLGPRWRGAFGTLPDSIDLPAILERAGSA
jgi:putative acyl-CoA dehydrogenase